MKIRLLKPRDITAAVAIVRQNFPPDLARRAKHELADMFGTAAIKPVYLVAEEKGKLLGLTAYIQSWMDYNVYEIFWVNVAPRRQRQGVGKKLVRAAIAQIKKQPGAGLILLTARAAANLPRYYQEQFGFKTIEKFMQNKYHLMALRIKKK